MTTASHDDIAALAARSEALSAQELVAATVERSIDFLKTAGLSDTDAEIETDRYICWPGQALTYKIGQRAIETLRREIAARDGSAFDLRAFHDAVLGHGSMPLATLQSELPTWVATPA